MKDTKVLLVVVLALLLYAGYMMMQQQVAQPGHAAQLSTLLVGGVTQHTTSTRAGRSRSTASGYAVSGSPTVSGAFIDSILCQYSGADVPHVSPACGSGPDLYALGVKYHIDPVFALAFFKHESSFGRYGIANGNQGIGNIRCSDAYLQMSGHMCKNGFRSYASWQAGYEDWYILIRYYVDDWNKPNVPDIVRTYAPSNENDTEGYIIAIEQAVDKWRSTHA
jgi:hypothetical protein